MLLIAVYYGRCGMNLRAKLYTVINSLAAEHAYLKTLYTQHSRMLIGGVMADHTVRHVQYSDGVTILTACVKASIEYFERSS